MLLSARDGVVQLFVGEVGALREGGEASQGGLGLQAGLRGGEPLAAALGGLGERVA